jgi:DNA-binding protein H-NS
MRTGIADPPVPNVQHTALGMVDLTKGVNMATYVELKEQAEDLMRQAEAARKAELSSVLADIKAKMVAYGITVEDLGGKAKAARGRKPKLAKAARPAKPVKDKAKPAKSRKPVAVKYRTPETGETWTGRGKAPKWLVAMEVAGRKREEFLVG